MNDVPATLQRIQAIGRNSLVTYFAGEMDTLDIQILTLPGAVSEILEFEQAPWRAAWWRGGQV